MRQKILLGVLLILASLTTGWSLHADRKCNPAAEEEKAFHTNATVSHFDEIRLEHLESAWGSAPVYKISINGEGILKFWRSEKFSSPLYQEAPTQTLSISSEEKDELLKSLSSTNYFALPRNDTDFGRCGMTVVCSDNPETRSSVTIDSNEHGIHNKCGIIKRLNNFEKVIDRISANAELLKRNIK